MQIDIVAPYLEMVLPHIPSLECSYVIECSYIYYLSHIECSYIVLAVSKHILVKKMCVFNVHCLGYPSGKHLSLVSPSWDLCCGSSYSYVIVIYSNMQPHVRIML